VTLRALSVRPTCEDNFREDDVRHVPPLSSVLAESGTAATGGKT
jgi:hypothetical protein